MEIHFGKGLEPDVWFGVGAESLSEKFGVPDRAYEMERDDEEGRRDELVYNSIQTCFRLYEGRLGWLQTSNPDLLLFGQRIMGRSPSLVIELIAKAGYGQPEVTEYDTFASVFWDSVWFEVQYVYDRVRDVNFGLLIDDDSNEYIWPVQDLGWSHNAEA